MSSIRLMLYFFFFFFFLTKFVCIYLTADWLKKLRLLEVMRIEVGDII